MKAHLILLVVAVLMGCASSPKEPTVVMPNVGPNASPVSGTKLDKVKETIDADPRLLTECGSFSDVAEGSNLDDLLAYHKSDAVVMGDCKRRTSELIKLIKDSFGLK